MVSVGICRVRATIGFGAALFAAACSGSHPALESRAADVVGEAAPLEASVPVAVAPPVPTNPPSSEAPLAVGGTHLLVAAGRILDPDTPALESAMLAAYGRMRADEDDPASVVHVRQTPLAPDLLVYEAKAPSRTAVLFLHGYGGRFALPCWQIAHAVAALGAGTACPSIGVEGDWWTAAGQRGVRAAADALHAAGYERIVLAGLSNGGIGASRLAARMKGTFAAVVLISGADPGAAPPGVPVLVVHGRRDAMSSAAGARAYARKAGATYVEVDAGHFAMLLRAGQVDRAIIDFVASLG